MSWVFHVEEKQLHPEYSHSEAAVAWFKTYTPCLNGCLVGCNAALQPQTGWCQLDVPCSCVTSCLISSEQNLMGDIKPTARTRFQHLLMITFFTNLIVLNVSETHGSSHTPTVQCQRLISELCRPGQLSSSHFPPHIFTTTCRGGFARNTVVTSAEWRSTLVKQRGVHTGSITAAVGLSRLCVRCRSAVVLSLFRVIECGVLRSLVAADHFLCGCHLRIIRLTGQRRINAD